VDLAHWAGLAATTFVAALLYAVSGFGFAVLAAPLFLLFADPAQAIQLVIIVSTALSFVVLPGVWRAIAPGLLLRFVLGSLAGLPLGLFAFRFADPVIVRGMAGATILTFAALMTFLHRRHSGLWALLVMRPSRDVAAGAISGFAAALVGMAGPPVLIYLLLGGGAAEDGARDPAFVFLAVVRGDIGGPRGDNRCLRSDLALRRHADPACRHRRLCWSPARRPPRRRRFRAARHWSSRGGRALYGSGCRRFLCGLPAMNR
jgi:hypothetical protein